MAREIDILRAAARRGCAVVEKDTNLLWGLDELNEVNLTDCFESEDNVAAPDARCAVTDVFPGCGQQVGRPTDLTGFRVFGQTGHFLIFLPPQRTTIT
ncbi:MAG: hypothetical protein L0Z62_12970 [Gemmataceae bacterium]|nr:hypothetical protein [Gemmataceae bacterium]